jgi:predicted SprT family Zn-dependent metalloprotease
MKGKTNGLSRGTGNGNGNYTAEEYWQLGRAYDFLNERLFDGSLTPLMITYRGKAGRLGKYVPDHLSERGGSRKTAELMLNPDHFGENDEDILAGFTAGIAQHWQYECGNPSRPGYYNQEWRDKMQSIGLPTSGRGQKVAAITIEEDGLFQTAVRELVTSGFKVRWQSHEEKPEKKKEKSQGKPTYRCRGCGQNTWSKPGAELVCGKCGLEMLALNVNREPARWTRTEEKQAPNQPKPSKRDANLAVLGLAPSVPDYLIKAAHRAHAKHFHPDRAGGDAEMMKQINAAFDSLKIK